MREIRTLRSMSGERKRSDGPTRTHATAPLPDSTEICLSVFQVERFSVHPARQLTLEQVSADRQTHVVDNDVVFPAGADHATYDAAVDQLPLLMLRLIGQHFLEVVERHPFEAVLFCRIDVDRNLWPHAVEPAIR